MPIVTLPTAGAPSLLEIDEFGATDEEYDAVRNCHLPVLLRAVPSGVTDLRVLEPVVDVLESLSVVASGVSNFDGLARMPRLSSLIVTSETTGARDLRPCVALQDYWGSFDEIVHLREGAAYDGLTLFGTDFSSLASWRGTVRDVRLMATRPTALDLTDLGDVLRGAEEVTVDGFRSVRLPSPNACPNLHTLTIKRGALTGLAAMAASPGLVVDLEDVHPIADWELVSPPKGGRVTLRGRSSADAAFRASHDRAQGWYFLERSDH